MFYCYSQLQNDIMYTFFNLFIFVANFENEHSLLKQKHTLFNGILPKMYLITNFI